MRRALPKVNSVGARRPIRAEVELTVERSSDAYEPVFSALDDITAALRRCSAANSPAMPASTSAGLLPLQAERDLFLALFVVMAVLYCVLLLCVVITSVFDVASCWRADRRALRQLEVSGALLLSAALNGWQRSDTMRAHRHPRTRPPNH